MPMTPGLVPNIRQVFPAPEEVSGDPGLAGADAGAEDGDDIVEGSGDKAERDDKGNILKVEHDDGSITISLDGSPLSGTAKKDPLRWFDNLVEDISDLELNRISDDLMRGVSDDLDSRKDWLENRANGIKLLGTKIEIPGLGGSSDGAPVEGMSRVRHPLLLEAVLRFQANARGELLPTDGPVKVRVDDNNADLGENELADALENDLNHYLTVTASEYYPDTDRMLLMLGFGGTAFKKVYNCPLRNRPVSETVDAEDLIVNNAATDLRNAKRITHRITMRPSTVKRLQILEVYRDIELSLPNPVDIDSAAREKKSQEGISPDVSRPEDRDREIYEIYCELDIDGFNHKHKGKVSGLEIPYCVTIDVSTKKVLSIVRNYEEGVDELPDARQNFVKFPFVPGFGFYDLGLLNLIGNTTNAVTAAWREMLDAGMYASFPGFLMADTGARQNTNIFRVPPGGGALVKTGGMPISQAVMPLPYKDPSQALMNLITNMVETGQRVGGTAELQVGEGRQDAPVGTTIALIEQAQKVMSAVHKRLHASQSEEFQLLARCFRENPKAFWQRNKKPARPWDEATFLKALENYSLVPQADPNTASHMQRIMKVMALKQLQAAQPGLYDPIAIDTAALRAMGWSNPQEFMAPVEAQGKPPPEMQKIMADMAIKKQQAEASMMDAQTRAKKAEADVALAGGRLQADVKNNEAKNQIDAAKAVAQKGSTQEELRSKSEERISQERIQLIDIAQNLAVHPETEGLVAPLIQPALQNVMRQQESQDELRRAKNAGAIPGGLVPPDAT